MSCCGLWQHLETNAKTRCCDGCTSTNCTHCTIDSAYCNKSGRLALQPSPLLNTARESGRFRGVVGSNRQDVRSGDYGEVWDFFGPVADHDRIYEGGRPAAGAGYRNGQDLLPTSTAVVTSRTPSSPIRAITAKRRKGSSRRGYYRAQFVERMGTLLR